MQKADVIQLALRGVPEKRGLEHGAVLKKEIVPRVHRLWKKATSEYDIDLIRKNIDLTYEYLEKTFPILNEEIRGLGDSAGLSFEQIFLFY